MIVRPATAAFLLATLLALGAGQVRAADVPAAAVGEAPQSDSAGDGVAPAAETVAAPVQKPAPVRLDPPSTAKDGVIVAAPARKSPANLTSVRHAVCSVSSCDENAQATGRAQRRMTAPPAV